MFQTNRLVIIGGPSAVGKSTLLNSIQQGNNSVLCNQIALLNPDSCLYLDAAYLSKVRQSIVNRLILHYDFITQYSPKKGFAYLSNLIYKSNNVCVLTLCTPLNILFQRISLRLERVIKYSPNARAWIKRLQRKEKMYKDQEKLLEAYERWLELIKECGVTKHMIINSAANYQFYWSSDQSEARKILVNMLFEKKLNFNRDWPL